MNKEIYIKNMRALMNYQPNLVKALDGSLLEEQDKIVITEGYHGTKLLQIKNHEGNYIQWNSYYDPFKEAKEVTKHIDYNINRSLIIAVGVGLGYHLNEICNNLNEKTRILAIEKNLSVLKNLFYYNDFSNEISNGKIFFIGGNIGDKSNIETNIANWMKTLFKNILHTQPMILPIYDLEYISFCNNVLKYIGDLKANFIFSLGNSLDDTILGVYNRIRNLPHIIENPGINDLLNKYGEIYKNKPAVIIASGPSLDKNIHLLKKIEGKGLLLACDGSMESLKEYDIAPDVVSSIERIKLTYEAFYKNKKMPFNTVLAAPAVVWPDIFDTFDTKTLSIFKEESFGRYFNNMVLDKGTVWSGASVAHQLLGIAHKLGASPIILVGQDLAYSAEGVSHVDKASVKEKVDLKNINLYVDDIFGNKVPTTVIWKRFLETYELVIRANNIECIDATEGGALIKGTQIMTLSEVIDKYFTNVEDIPRMRELVDSLELSEDYFEKAYKKSIISLIKLIKKFYIVYKRAEIAKTLNYKAKKLLVKGIKNDEELDVVYDALEYTENKIIKGSIIKKSEINMFFQYSIMKVVDEVNNLGSEVTFEILEENIDIHNNLLKELQHYSIKVIEVLSSGFEYIKKTSKTKVGNDEIESIEFPKWIV